MKIYQEVVVCYEEKGEVVAIARKNGVMQMYRTKKLTWDEFVNLQEQLSKDHEPKN